MVNVRAKQSALLRGTARLLAYADAAATATGVTDTAETTATAANTAAAADTDASGADETTAVVATATATDTCSTDTTETTLEAATSDDADTDASDTAETTATAATAADADTDTVDTAEAAAAAAAAAADADTTDAAKTAAAAGGAPAQPFSWPQRRLLACLSAGSLLDGCLQAIQLPFFPSEAQRRGLSLAASGAVFSCFALTEMLAYPVMGWLAPRLGVKRLYVIGLTIAGLNTLVFGLLTFVQEPSAFLAACVLVRAAEAVGTAAALTAVRTIVINQFQSRVNMVIAVIESVKAAGLCVGPALGGALYALGGYGAPFYTLGGLMVGSAVTSLVVMPGFHDAGSESEPQEEDGKSAPRHRYLRMASLVACCPDNWLNFALLFVVAMNWWALDPSLGPYVQCTLDMGPAELGLFYVASLSAFALASPLWSRIADAIDNTFLLLAGCLAPAGVGILLVPPAPLLGLAPSRFLLALGMVLRETFNIGAYLPMLALLLRCSVAHGLPNDVHGQALVSAMFGAVYNVGKVVWPLVGAAAIELLGLPVLAAYMAAGSVTMALAVAVRGLVYRYRRQQPPTEQDSPERKTA